MNKSILVILYILLFTACKSDDGRSCVQCSSSQTSPFELCRESDNTASVNGENTGANYDNYLSDLEEVGVICGGS